MAFNVCDKSGRHIGFLYNIDFFDEDTTVVALSDKKIQELHFKHKDLQVTLAWIFEARTLLGKVNEEKLAEKLREYWQNNRELLGDFDMDYIGRIICLSRSHMKINEYFITSEGFIKGYILYDKSRVEFYDKETVIIKEELDYINAEIKVEGKLPLYAKIVDYPKIDYYDMIIPGSVGRTHYHTTRLKLESGNAETSIKIPTLLNIKKGMNIELYITEKKGVRDAFCDGVIYSFS